MNIHSVVSVTVKEPQEVGQEHPIRYRTIEIITEQGRMEITLFSASSTSNVAIIGD
tara:strand:- start:642 stop:809 length:168 start_codon:yes stop_codon:yes gene_type:complete